MRAGGGVRADLNRSHSKGDRKDDAIALRAVQARRVEPNRPGGHGDVVVETVRRPEYLVAAARSIDRNDPRSHTRS